MPALRVDILSYTGLDKHLCILRQLFAAAVARQPAKVVEQLVVEACAQLGINEDTVADPDELLARSAYAELGAARGLQVMRVLRER